MTVSVDVEGLVEAQMTGKAGTCQTCRWLRLREPAERAKWDKVMNDPLRWPHSAVHRALNVAHPDEISPGRGSVENHRNNKHKP